MAWCVENDALFSIGSEDSENIENLRPGEKQVGGVSQGVADSRQVQLGQGREALQIFPAAFGTDGKADQGRYLPQMPCAKPN